MTPDQFKLLVDRYITGDCSPEDQEQLRLLLEDPTYVDQLALIMDQQLEQNQATETELPEATRRIQETVAAQISQSATVEETEAPKRGIVYVLRKWAVAASILTILSLLAIFLLNKSDDSSNLADHPSGTPAPIEAGKDGAILTLVDGTTVVLDSMGNGLVTTQNGTKVLLKNGQLVYDQENSDVVMTGYNSMSTPKGRQFKMVLPDGTKVWLNAASSIRYPIVFTGNDRRVDITGEAYFEVAKNKEKPFIVATHSGTEIEVLGTQFNINSYDNEETINTTLLEGSVRVSNKEGRIELTPGQQAQSTHTALTVKQQVNVAQVMAWKNGQFDFNNASLREVMRQLERWYNIEVEYAPGVKNYEFVGKMDRGLSLQEVLKGLEMSEVRFEITNERKIIVKP